MLQVSQKNGHISFKNQLLVGGWIFFKYWFSKEIWLFFWDTWSIIFGTLCMNKVWIMVIFIHNSVLKCLLWSWKLIFFKSEKDDEFVHISQDACMSLLAILRGVFLIKRWICCIQDDLADWWLNHTGVNNVNVQGSFEDFQLITVCV